MEKTRNLMLGTLRELSVSTPPGSQAPSPTPLLQAERNAGYQSTALSDEALVEATVDGDGGKGNEVTRNASADAANQGKRYAIA
jgi:hypothetical protein